jgi:uncharacterized membrane protein YqjE
MGIAFISAFLYNFLLFDISYFESNEVLLSVLFLISLIFLLFAFIIVLIRQIKYFQLTPYNFFKTGFLVILLLINIVSIWKFTIQYNNINKDYVLPTFVTPKNIFTDRKELQRVSVRNGNIHTPRGADLSKQISNKDTLTQMANLFSNKSVTSITLLKNLKLYCDKEEIGYYDFYFNYPSEMSSNITSYSFHLNILDNGIVTFEEGAELFNQIAEVNSSNTTKKTKNKYILKLNAEDIKKLMYLLSLNS